MFDLMKAFGNIEKMVKSEFFLSGKIPLFTCSEKTSNMKTIILYIWSINTTKKFDFRQFRQDPAIF